MAAKTGGPDDGIPPLTVVHCDSLEGLEAAVRGGAKRLIFGGESYNHTSFTQEIWKKAVAIGHKSNVPFGPEHRVL